MSVPFRYYKETYAEDGAWWRGGRAGRIRVWDQLDTSAMHHGRRDPFCEACQDGIAHTQRFHNEAVIVGRKKVHCTPGREHLVNFD